LLAVSLLLQTAVYVFLDKSKFFSDTAWLFTQNKEVQTSKLAERITRLWLCKKNRERWKPESKAWHDCGCAQKSGNAALMGTRIDRKAWHDCGYAK
jgi:hypothetical protein